MYESWRGYYHMCNLAFYFSVSKTVNTVYNPYQYLPWASFPAQHHRKVNLLKITISCHLCYCMFILKCKNTFYFILFYIEPVFSKSIWYQSRPETRLSFSFLSLLTFLCCCKCCPTNVEMWETNLCERDVLHNVFVVSVLLLQKIHLVENSPSNQINKSCKLVEHKWHNL